MLDLSLLVACPQSLREVVCHYLPEGVPCNDNLEFSRSIAIIVERSAIKPPIAESPRNALGKAPTCRPGLSSSDPLVQS
jgi:hypothetical protein